MKSRIVLIRHGITVGNEQRLYYGATDVELSERGKKQLKKLAEEGLYPDNEDAEYYTSGMLRTEQTFNIIYGDKAHERIPDLCELNFGEFEMRSYEQLSKDPAYQAWLAAEDDNFVPPGGESIRMFNERILRGFADLLVKHETLMLKLRNREKEAVSICVCHGGVISGIMSNLWPGKRDNFFSWIPDPGHGFIIHMEDGKAVREEEF